MALYERRCRSLPTAGANRVRRYASAMRSQLLGSSTLAMTRIIYGCMPLGGTWDDTPHTPAQQAKAVRAIRAAIDAGTTCFDHADIYCRGKSETVFAEALAEVGVARERLVLQSKCGIRFADDPRPGCPQRFDFSRAHIVASVDGILRRLKTGWIDVLLLHRPDALMEPEEVAQAFDELVAAGKVRHVGVSNQNPGQMELLRRHLRQPLVVNQLELSLVHNHLIDAGITMNQQKNSFGADGTLDYCRLHRITIQAWAPLAGGRALGGDGDEKAKLLATTVARIAAAHRVAPEAIPIAWLLRHPAGIQPVIGSTDPTRIAQAFAGDVVDLTREEWYALYAAGRGERMP